MSRRVPRPLPERTSPEPTCPSCGAADALVLFRSVECPREGCSLYSLSAEEHALRRRIERAQAERARRLLDEAPRCGWGA